MRMHNKQYVYVYIKVTKGNGVAPVLAVLAETVAVVSSVETCQSLAVLGRRKGVVREGVSI